MDACKLLFSEPECRSRKSGTLGDVNVTTKDTCSLDALKVKVSKSESKSAWFGLAKDRTDDAWEEGTVFRAIGGDKFKVTSTQGKVLGEGAQVLCKGGIQIFGEKGIDLKPLMLDSSHYHYSRTFELGLGPFSFSFSTSGVSASANVPVVSSVIQTVQTANNSDSHIVGVGSDAVGTAISAYQANADLNKVLAEGGSFSDFLSNTFNISTIKVGFNESETTTYQKTANLGVLSGSSLSLGVGKSGDVHLSTHVDAASTLIDADKVTIMGGTTTTSSHNVSSSSSLTLDLKTGGLRGFSKSNGHMDTDQKRTVFALMNFGKTDYVRDRTKVEVCGAQVHSSSTSGGCVDLSEHDVQDHLHRKGFEASVNVGFAADGNLSSFGGGATVTDLDKWTTAQSSYYSIDKSHTGLNRKEKEVQKDSTQGGALGFNYQHTVGKDPSAFSTPFSVHGQIGDKQFHASIPKFNKEAYDADQVIASKVKRIQENCDPLPSQLLNFLSAEEAEENDRFFRKSIGEGYSSKEIYSALNIPTIESPFLPFVESIKEAAISNKSQDESKVEMKEIEDFIQMLSEPLDSEQENTVPKTQPETTDSEDVGHLKQDPLLEGLTSKAKESELEPLRKFLSTRLSNLQAVSDDPNSSLSEREMATKLLSDLKGLDLKVLNKDYQHSSLVSLFTPETKESEPDQKPKESKPNSKGQETCISKRFADLRSVISDQNSSFTEKATAAKLLSDLEDLNMKSFDKDYQKVLSTGYSGLLSLFTGGLTALGLFTASSIAENEGSKIALKLGASQANADTWGRVASLACLLTANPAQAINLIYHAVGKEAAIKTAEACGATSTTVDIIETVVNAGLALHSKVEVKAPKVNSTLKMPFSQITKLTGKQAVGFSTKP